MEIKCGIDIIEISRIKESIENDTQEKFKNRVFTQREIEYCENKKKQKYQHYAARFATKEAAFKALSEKIPDKYAIEWKNIETFNDSNGRPQIKLMGIEEKDIENIDVSISHCKEYAVANVVILFK
ncbi:MAG: holo-ACP synthase [Clostridia bacterium]|nr:holo-ACP synthase [Clostridia bacterium]